MKKIYASVTILTLLAGFVLLPGAFAAEAPYWIGTYSGTVLISPSPVLFFSDGSAVFVSYIKEDNMVKYSVLRKVAPNGSVEWAVKYGSGFIVSALAKSPGRDMVAAGACLPKGLANPDGFLMKLDKKGRVLWAKRYGGSGTDSLTALTVLENGDILAAGMTTSFGDGRGDVWLLKADGKGNVIWERTYGTGWMDEPLSILVEPNGDILIGGVSSHDNVPYGLILAVEGNGNLKWAKEYRIGTGLVIRGLSYLNGDVYASGYTNPGNDTIAAVLMKLDGEGNLLWSGSYYRKGFFLLGGNVVSDSSGLWIPGALVGFLNGTAYYGVLLHVSSGTPVGVRSYGPGMSFRALRIAPDGSILVSGVMANNGSGGPLPLLARLPENGSLPNCRYLANLTVEEGTPKVMGSPINLSTGEPKFTVGDASVAFEGMTGSASLICTYTPPAEKGKGICGPGFIALLALFAAFSSKRH